MTKMCKQSFFALVILLAGVFVLLNEAGILNTLGKQSGRYYIFLLSS